MKCKQTEWNGMESEKTQNVVESESEKQNGMEWNVKRKRNVKTKNEFETGELDRMYSVQLECKKSRMEYSISK